MAGREGSTFGDVAVGLYPFSTRLYVPASNAEVVVCWAQFGTGAGPDGGAPLAITSSLYPLGPVVGIGTTTKVALAAVYASSITADKASLQCEIVKSLFMKFLLKSVTV